MSRSRKRAVSDVVSFTLVFSTIIFMIGVVTVTGIGTLGDVQEGTETNVAEETMRSYAATLADHRKESAPIRSSTIKLQGHSFEHVPSTLNVTAGGTQVDIPIGALVRTTDTDAELVYETGALFRVQDGGSVVVRKPPIRCGPDSVHLPLTRVAGDFALSADGRVSLESKLEDRRIYTFPLDSSDEVIINTSQTARPGAWQSALEGSSWSRDGTEYTCTEPAERVVVHETDITVSVIS